MRTIHHVVDIDAPAGTVWAALTEQERMARWWSTTVESPAPSVGARTHWTFACRTPMEARYRPDRCPFTGSGATGRHRAKDQHQPPRYTLCRWSIA